MNLLIKSFFFILMSIHHFFLLIFQLLDGGRSLREELALFIERLLERLIFHFQLDIRFDDVSCIGPAQRLSYALFQQKHAQLQVEIFMLELLQLFLIFLDAPST